MKKVLAGPLAELQEIARHIADVSNECKLPLSSDEYVDSFKATLMDVVHAWSKVRLAFSSLHCSPCCFTQLPHSQQLLLPPFLLHQSLSRIRQLEVPNKKNLGFSG